MLSFILLGLVVWVCILLSRPQGQNQADVSMRLESRNIEWAQFIAQYYDRAKTKSERQLIKTMLADIAARGLPAPIVGGNAQPTTAPVQHQAETAYPVNEAADYSSREMTTPVQDERQVQLDNASLLLYFGAFLFVAAVGLFVAFGGLPGSARTLAVLLVSAVMYAAGIWLFRTKPKFEQAGLAFAGIGIAAAPFVGLAAYNFIFDQSSAPIVWFATSVLCLGMYAHALITLKKPLLSYVLLFTMLSLVESGVAVIEMPIYYFGWGLALVGIGFAFMTRIRNVDAQLADSADKSSRLFVPVSVVAALLMLPGQGFVQLGVSLLLASLFYLFDAWYGRFEYRANNLAAVQVLATGGTVALLYGLTDSSIAAALGLCAITSLTMAAALMPKVDTEVLQNTALISVAFSLLAVWLSASSSLVLVCAVALGFVQCMLLWVRRERDDAYVLAMIAWFALPIIVGQYLLSPRIDAAMQTGLLAASLLAVWGLVFFAQRKRSDDWLMLAKTVYVLAGLLVIGWATLTTDMILFAVCAVIAVSVVLLAERDKLSDWTVFAGSYLLIPIALHDTPTWFMIAAITALLANIAIALRYRQEFSRWLSTGLWLFLPVSIAPLILDWGTRHFVLAYIIVMMVLILSRAIARGVILPSSKVKLASYARTASLSYVFGYVAAAVIALGAALTVPDGRMTVALTLGVLLFAVLLLAHSVEKQPQLYVGVPVLLQALLFVLMQPSTEAISLNTYLAASLAISCLGYALWLLAADDRSEARSSVADGSLAMALLPASSVFFVAKTELMMPVGLAVFSVMLYLRFQSASQSDRELIGGLGLLSIWWLMYFMDVTTLQAYTHVLAALFAGYAYWRYVRGDRRGSDSYLYAMLATATIPLILQALGGKAGDLYGWWLLLEQVVFILIGMAIGRGFVTRWGLYVAVGAVLYQLRGLGWAALAVLAIFIIGLAVYKLQKQDSK